MRKIYSLLLTVVLFGALKVNAQTNANYTSGTNATASLTDMSSGTTELSLAAATLPNSVYHDDDASPVTLFTPATNPFVFYFMGKAYDRFSVNSNGQCKLGNSGDLTAISGTNISSPAATTAYLCPFTGDNAMQPAGKVHYKVTGTAPNRVATVEWILRLPYAATPGAGTPSTLQLRISEATGLIEYVYGTMFMNSGTTTKSIAWSSSNTATTSAWIATITATPTNTYSTAWTTTSFTASASMTNLNSAADGSRRIFTWTSSVTPATPTTPSFTTVTPSTTTIN